MRNGPEDDTGQMSNGAIPWEEVLSNGILAKCKGKGGDMGMGIFWVLMAAVLLGFYALPSKYVKGYELENLWGGFWLLAMFVVPSASTLVLVDNLCDTYAQVSPGVFAGIILLAMLWGVGNLLWGISISTIGMALGFSLLIGVTTFSGSVLPFFMGGLDQLATPGGAVIVAGILVIMLGIVANGKAGLLREAREKAAGEAPGRRSSMKAGIVMCVVGGLCAAGFNLSYHVADNIGHIGAISQEQYGNPPWIARLAVMLPSFIGSGIATVLYFVVRLSKKKAWPNFLVAGSGRNVLLLAVMAAVYCASLIIYGLGAYQLGALGTSVGFAIFQSGCILVANLLGLSTGEWKDAGPASKRWLAAGLAIMCCGMVVIAYGNSLLY